jgi:hypothetical protein
MWSDGVESSHYSRGFTRGSSSTCNFPRGLHALPARCNLSKGILSDLPDIFTSNLGILPRLPRSFVSPKNPLCSKHTSWRHMIYTKSKSCSLANTSKDTPTNRISSSDNFTKPLLFLPSLCLYMIRKQGVLLPVLPLSSPRQHIDDV